LFGQNYGRKGDPAFAIQVGRDGALPLEYPQQTRLMQSAAMLVALRFIAATTLLAKASGT